MADLFLYGTLCHVPLLSRVLGRDARAIDILPATLPGWAVHWADGERFPMVRQSDGGTARGLLVRGLGEADLARLDHYEGGFGYALEPLEVRTDGGEICTAQVFLPDPEQWTAGAPWRLEDWVARYGDMTLEAADEVMEHFGASSAQEIRALFPFIRARGWSRLLGRKTAPREVRRDPAPGDVTVEDTRQGYDGFFRIRSFDVSHRKFDGGRSETVRREAILAFDAALVLPYDPKTDHVLLIEQLRFGPIFRSDPATWVLEPIAGLIDAGEDPEDCARREAEEEADLKLGDLIPMTRVYASPGYSTEFFHCYLGLCNLSQADEGIGGKDDEHEDIRSHVMSFDRAMELLDSGEINGGPMALMLLWLARYRERTRQDGRSTRP